MVKRFFAYVMLFMLAAVPAGCDHTRLSGEIIIPDTGIEVGDKVPLRLEVPEELSGIYRTMWNVDPAGKGVIMEGDKLLETLAEEELRQYFGKSEGLNPDRIALFTAGEKGSCTIYADGFYRQTNPQAIAFIEIEIE